MTNFSSFLPGEEARLADERGLNSLSVPTAEGSPLEIFSFLSGLLANIAYSLI